MRWLIAAVITVMFMTLSDSHFLDHVTCSDGNPAPYRISQPSTNGYVQIVSPDATQLTLMCSLNITIPSGMTITWLHDDHVEATIMTQDDQKINTVSLIKGRPRPSDAGVYQCVFNDTNGCILSANITVEFRSSTITSALAASTTVIAVTDMVNSTYYSLTQSATHSLTTATHALITTIVTTSLIDLSVTATSAHTVTHSTNHTASSVASTTDASSTTDVSTIATKSADLSITAITNLANIATTFTISPTLSPSQPDSNSSTDYFSVGILVAAAVVLVVVFVIIAMVVVGIIVVCYKRNRSKQCTEQEDADYMSITDEKLSQRPPASILETAKLERQDNENPYIQVDETIMQDHYYSIPFENQLKMQHEQVNIQANPAYVISHGMNTPTEVNYYNVNTACYKYDTG